MNFVTVITPFIDRMVKGYVVTFQKYKMKLGSLHQCNDKIRTKEDVNL